MSESSGSYGDEYEDDCLLRCYYVVLWVLTDISEELTAPIISCYESSVNNYIPQDSHLQENVTSHF
jgi:hypothetical protein